MRYYTLMSNDGDTRVVVETPRGMAYDLTSVEPDLVDIADLVQAGFLSGVTPDDIAKRLLSDGNADSFDLAEVMDGTRDGSAFYRVDRPFEPPEVWAAGVTYKTSEDGTQAGERHPGRVQRRLYRRAPGGVLQGDA